LGDRLAGASHLCALPRDDRQLLDGGVELLRVGLSLADAHVERDLLEARRLHDRAQLELLLQVLAQLRLVQVLQAGRVAVGAHLSISWPQSARLQTRMRTCLSCSSRSTMPSRRGRLQPRATDMACQRE